MPLKTTFLQNDAGRRTLSFCSLPGTGSGHRPQPSPICRFRPSLSSFRSRFLRSLLLASLAIPAIPAGSAVGSGDTLAVLTVESGSRLDRDAASLATDAVRREIGASGRFQVLEQGRVDAFERGRSSKERHCASKDCAVEAGKALSAGTVVIGVLTRSGSIYYLSLKRVDVGTQTVASIVEDRSSVATEDLREMSRRAAKRLLGSEMPAPQRAAEPRDERFIVHEGAVFDRETKLTWMRAPDGEGKAMTWDEAEDYVRRLNRTRSAEYDNWRLPGRDELATLQAYANGRGVKMNLHELFMRIGFRSIRADYYWSATSSDDMPGLAWTIDMYGGGVSLADKNGKGYVWPVRTGPWLFEEPAARP